MTSFTKLTILSTVLVVIFPLQPVLSNNTRQSSKVKFKYIIFNNTLNDKFGFQHSRRTMNVFLEEKAFSEQTLRELYSLLSSRFPAPQWLEVWVYTNLNQVETPEEADLPKSSTTPDHPELNRYHWAWMYRNNGNELFRYNSSPPERKTKTVVINGNDPYEPNK